MSRTFRVAKVSKNVPLTFDFTKVKSLPYQFSLNGSNFELLTSERIHKTEHVIANGELNNMELINLPNSSRSLPRKIKPAKKKMLSIDKDGKDIPVCIVRK